MPLLEDLDKNKILYANVSEKGGCIKLSDKKSDRDKMGVYIKNRKLYYMVDGEFYTFKFNRDGISVGLTPKKVKQRIEFYTWKDSEEEDEPKPSKKLNYLDLQPGKKSQSGQKNVDAARGVPQGKFVSMKNKAKIDDYEKWKESLNKKASRKNLKTHEETTQKNVTVEKIEQKKIVEKINKDIESDNEERGFDESFDLKIKMSDSKLKYFNLVNNDQCLTYFKQSFIMTKCSCKITTQIFKLKLPIDIVLKDDLNIKRSQEKRKSIKTDFFSEHSSSEIENKKEMNKQLKEKLNKEIEANKSQPKIIKKEILPDGHKKVVIKPAIKETNDSLEDDKLNKALASIDKMLDFN